MQRITLDDVREFFTSTYRPNGAILSVAGNIDFPQLRDQVGELFADVAAGARPASGRIARRCASPWHIPHDSNQTHITIGYESVPYAHPDYYQARAAVGVLSDGMSSRLFTEVREKRGLCYAVYAVCHTLRDRGSVFCYAGTTTERAQDTLDVMMHELRELSAGRARRRTATPQGASEERADHAAGIQFRAERFDRRRLVLPPASPDPGGSGPDRGSADVREHQRLPGRSILPADFLVVTLGQSALELPR